VRLPASVARAARLTADPFARITVEDGRVVITPRGDRPPTLADRLAWYDPAGAALAQGCAVLNPIISIE
jgi:hypothetical protein